METIKEPESEWAKILSEILSSEMSKMSVKMMHMVQKIDDLVESNLFLEQNVEKSIKLSEKSAGDVSMLEKKIQELKQDNEKLRNRISYAETYSKKVNPKFFNLMKPQMFSWTS